MTKLNKIRILLKNVEPYKIEQELYPNLFYKTEIDKWIFFYSFCRRLNDISIGYRVGLERSQVYRRTITIIKDNLTCIIKFLEG